MRPTADIAPLAELAEAEFVRLRNEAEAALNALGRFWSRLYGPNEALAGAHEALLVMDREFFEREEEHEQATPLRLTERNRWLAECSCGWELEVATPLEAQFAWENHKDYVDELAEMARLAKGVET